MLNNTCEWKDTFFNGERYEVSRSGEVRNKETGKILVPKKSNVGYFRVTLCGKEGTRTVSVHRLVAMAFVPNPDGKPTVNHKDECKTNNRADNLEWMTNAEQNIHGTRVERVKSSTNYNARGIDYKSVARHHNYADPNMCGRKAVAVYRGEELVGIFESQKSASEFTGVSIGKVSACVNGKKNSCKGFTFIRIGAEDEQKS